ncbi:hypothetical protein [Asticcacaulis sp. 201]|uniref:hypothetical protein n=1 Tax=Asticcacaulis sp. 201 TaxID=3028787 RepID=UPI002916EE2B|nr:hypothetical protein [Asticcacaulis sp. 201]MDV6329964.1 hypothetical protein [Asticcacaulis sp. 201]
MRDSSGVIHRNHMMAFDRITGIEIFDNSAARLYTHPELKISRNYRIAGALQTLSTVGEVDFAVAGF